MWSASTHPTDFPAGAHFSRLVGGTHDANVAFWQPGATATVGIERMAEEGQTAPLTSEVNAAIAAGDATSAILGGSIPSSPGTATALFTITSGHPLATVVSMIAPSPDWFVGVNGLPLRAGGQWLDDVVVDLHPYDAGTDSGSSFEDPDDDTLPREPIAQITGFPFTGTGPLGTFTFELVATIGDCADGIDNDGDGLTDAGADPGCDSASDTSEKSAALVCDDGLDNDGDQKIDFPADPDCETILGTSEGLSKLPTLSATGTAALAVLLACAAAVHFRRNANAR